MADKLDFFTADQMENEVKKRMSFMTSHYIPSIADKRAVLLGGQSGAGKTTLHTIYSEVIAPAPIIINGDEYRKSHPHFAELNEAYGKEAVDHTSAWSGGITEALIDGLSKLGYNLVIEGTLRTSAVPLKTAELLRSRGYEVSLALMAVKPEVSLLSCQIRYETMRIAGTTPRATSPAHHMKIVQDIVGNLEALEQSGLFSGIFLYNRAEACLYPAENDARTASEVLREVLFGEWSEEELQHKSNLELELQKLQEQ